MFKTCNYCKREPKWVEIKVRGPNIRVCSRHKDRVDPSYTFPIGGCKLIKTERPRYRLIDKQWVLFIDPILKTYASDMNID